MISDEVGLAITNDCDFDDYVFSSTQHNVSKSCNKALNKAEKIVGDYINNYDVILDVCYPSIVEQELRLKKMATKISIGVDVCMDYERSFYFNLPEVQKALHENRTNLPYQWNMCSGFKISWIIVHNILIKVRLTMSCSAWNCCGSYG
ncbi:serine carboxypeptidase-like 42 [Cajanus cajan]|uniref:serine carboxypeptidase-like 42 n=1 Tax=Cajanus cajan TaxID=3821 RepID=UPI0010FB72C0|nr:serine carboxypeptidase-like 42 [Cajanus cajan]